MAQVPNPYQGFSAGLIYDESTERHFLLHSLPTFSSALKTSKRLLGISQTNASLTSIGADTDALPMLAETLHFETSTATFAISKNPILQGHTRSEHDQDVGSSRSLGSPFDEISARDEARRYWIYHAHDPPRRVGTAWRVAEMGGEAFRYDAAQFVLLSQSRCLQRSVTEWHFDSSVGEWGVWCMLKVMLVRSGHDNGGEVVERVTIGKIREDAWKDAAPVKKTIVLR